MGEKKYSWHKIADSINEILFEENNLTEIEVSGKKICIGKSGSNLFACASKCPHASGRISDGFVDAQGNIVCPLHRYRFNTLTGRNTSGEGYYLKTYLVEQKEDGIYIGIEENKSFFGWLG
jgi:nitrite reductase/ring-hydroxylating ferredoxin subunit